MFNDNLAITWGDYMYFELQTTQKMTQKLSNEQLQNLEILQFSSQELERYIIEKANENPLITVVETNLTELNQLISLSINRPTKTNYQSQGMANDFFQETFAKEESAVKMILEQIPLHQNLSELDIKVLKYFIYNLDENFFLELDFNETANKFNVTEEYLQHILYLLQTFEPIGVGARNRTDFLLIQIDQDMNAPEYASRFVKYHLDKVASLSLKYLSKHYQISSKETKRTIQYIRNLNPSVASSIPLQSESGYIIPEVSVEKIRNEWMIQIHHPFLPKIDINEEYISLLQETKDNKEYCKHLLKDIVLLKEGIEQRDRTLYSITRLLLTNQEDFFNQGMSALKPLRLKDVAIALELHESTISRAIRNKHIITPHGTYAFRSLFVKGVANHSGKMDSVMYIKQCIAKLIEKENANKPLTDQQLTAIIQKEGIQIARRTIAKYREELNILSSSKRTQLYKI